MFLIKKNYLPPVLGVLVGLVHAVKAPLMLPFLRDVLALGKSAWEQLLYQEVFYGPVSLSGSHVCRTWGVCAVVWALGLQFLLKVLHVPELSVAKTNAMQMPQGRESSSLKHHLRTWGNPPGQVLHKSYEKGIVPTLEAAQGVLL